MIFVDYKQAYDSVNGKELWKAMVPTHWNRAKICKLRNNV